MTTATEPFRDHIGATIDPARVLVLPNGTTRAWLAVGQTEPDRAALGLPEDRFVWTYAGNVGLSHDLVAPSLAGSWVMARRVITACERTLPAAAMARISGRASVSKPYARTARAASVA